MMARATAHDDTQLESRLPRTQLLELYRGSDLFTGGSPDPA